MGCLDGNCAGSFCKPILISPHMPPKRVGWRLSGWPDFVPEIFRSKYAAQNGSEPVWDGNSAEASIGQVVDVLVANGVLVEKEELCRWANDQWCAADPDRCKAAQGKSGRLAEKRTFGYFGESMQWATPFWKLFNVALSDQHRPDSEARQTVELFAEAATHLVEGQSGCSKCAKHFRELQSRYPIGKITSWKQARVWLWRVHNESRDSGRAVPYHEIARIYGWLSLEPTEVLRIVEEELRA